MTDWPLTGSSVCSAPHKPGGIARRTTPCVEIWSAARQSWSSSISSRRVWTSSPQLRLTPSDIQGRWKSCMPRWNILTAALASREGVYYCFQPSEKDCSRGVHKPLAPRAEDHLSRTGSRQVPESSTRHRRSRLLRGIMPRPRNVNSRSDA